MLRWWKRLLRKKRKQSVASLRLKIERFRGLLRENNRVLDLLADADEKLGGDFLFDATYIRTMARDLEDAAAKVVRDLNFVTENRHLPLVTAYERVRGRVGDILAARIAVPDAPYIMPLESVDCDAADAVGEKMACLGEIGRRLHFRIPPGFVITSQAFKRFSDHARLEEKIRLLAARSPDGVPSPSEVEAVLGEAIAGARMPGDLRKAIDRAVAARRKRSGKDVLFAVRSSALGEDGELSFAGLHDSVLAVKPDGVAQAYKEVLASLFNARAVSYRLSRGEPLEPAVMAVGCVQMVDAVCSGVAYSLDPNDPERDVLIVTASPGLGKLVVEGSAGVDRFLVSRTPPHRVVERGIAVKERMYEIDPEGGVRLVGVPAAYQKVACVTDDFLAGLATAVLRIEQYSKSPQDVEWSLDKDGALVFLQSRPLHVHTGSAEAAVDLRAAVEGHEVLLSGRGTVTSRGIAHGHILLVDGTERLEEIPQGSVLVARLSAPHLAELVPRASAVITDIGSPTGHLATITRELRIPSIMDAAVATQVLKNGTEVTVDAEENVVYEGKVEELLLYQLLRKSSFQDSAEFRLLRRLLRIAAPLHLRNPRGRNFHAGNCESYHDVIRFSHEKAVEYLVGGQDLGSDAESVYCRSVNLHLPLDLKVINIGDVTLLPSNGSECEVGDIGSEPFRCLLEGITAPGAWSSEATNMDFKSFMSSVTGRSMLESPVSGAPPPNLGIFSENYLNLNLFLGYHYNQVDAYISNARNDNYLYFRFMGGMTSIARRSRRAKMIAIILERQDFAVDIMGDFLVARLKKFEKPILLERLRMIGCLIGYTRQLDVRMRSDTMIDEGVEEFFNYLYSRAGSR
jgi:pyruvate,water dikinase